MQYIEVGRSFQNLKVIGEGAVVGKSPVSGLAPRRIEGWLLPRLMLFKYMKRKMVALQFWYNAKRDISQAHFIDHHRGLLPPFIIIRQDCPQALNTYGEWPCWVSKYMSRIFCWGCAEHISFRRRILCLLRKIWGCMCSTDSPKFWRLRGYIFHCAVSSNRKYQLFPLLSYIPMLCTLDAFTIKFCQLFIYFSQNLCFVFTTTLQSIICVYNRVPYGLRVVFDCPDITYSIILM